MRDEENLGGESGSVMTMGEWIITLIISSIPLVGIIALLIWAFSSNTPKCKSNWAKAWLLLQVVGYMLVALLWGTLIGILTSGIFD